MRRAVLLMGMLSLLRCSGDPFELPPRPNPTPPDIVPPSVQAPLAPQPPRAPASVQSPQCAAGWRSDPRSGLCSPTLRDQDPQCPAGHARFASAPACAPLRECPQGDFAQLDPPPPSGTRVVYVKPGAEGDGQIESPFSTIAQAAALSLGSISRPLIIMLAKGVYEESVLLGRSVTLQGACAAQTHISSQSTDEPALDLRGTANIRDLSVSSRWFGARVRSGAVTFERVHLRDASTLGIGTDDGTTTILRSTRIDRISDSLQGRGRALELGGEIELERVWIEGSSMGIALVDANLIAQDLVVRGANTVALRANDSAVQLSRSYLAVDFEAEADGIAMYTTPDHPGSLLVEDSFVTGSASQLRAAIYVEERGQRATLRRTTVTNSAIGINPIGPLQLDLEDVAIIDVDQAIQGGDGVQLTARRMRIDGAKQFGLNLVNAPSHADIEDLELMDVGDGQTQGGGIGLFHGATLRLTRAQISRCAPYGAIVQGAHETPHVLQDVIIEDSFSDAFAGDGLIASGPIQLELNRVRLLRNSGHGLFLIGDGKMDVIAKDVTALSTRPTAETFPSTPPGFDGRSGYGIAVFDARLTLERAELSLNHEIGLMAQRAQVTARDLLITETDSDSSGQFGRGLTFFDSSADLSRVQLADNREVALTVFGEDAVVRAQDLSIRNTAEVRCSALVCGQELDPVGGIGAAAIGGELQIERFEILDNHVCGVQAAQGGRVQLSQGKISGHAIGACILSEDFDLRQLEDQVDFQDNDVKLSAAPGLYVPQVITPGLP